MHHMRNILSKKKNDLSLRTEFLDLVGSQPAFSNEVVDRMAKIHTMKTYDRYPDSTRFNRAALLSIFFSYRHVAFDNYIGGLLKNVTKSKMAACSMPIQYKISSYSHRIFPISDSATACQNQKKY